MTDAILDIPRYYTGIAEWMSCMIFIIYARPRINKKLYAAVAVVSLVLQCVFLEVTDDCPIYLWILCMLTAAAMMYGLIFWLCDVDALTAGYICVRAFLLAEFTASLEWQIHCYFWPLDEATSLQRFGLLILVYGSVFLVMALLEYRCNLAKSGLVITWHELLTTVVMGICVFAISNLSFYYKATPFSGQYASEILNIRTFVDLCGVILLYAYQLQRVQSQARRELDVMQSILENQYAQYRMSRDSIEMINQKYHDLKHQIAALRAENDATVRERWLDEMEEDIKTYEAQNKTGNSILDTLITGKSLYCQKHSIGFTVVADGKPLGMMELMDICTLFGNAMDNAIECELKIKDKSKRMIHLSLTTQKQFLVFQVENYCPEAPAFRGGVPVTTKEDRDNHGYGLKSIRKTARKYGGNATVQMKDDWFVLKVLLPLPKEESQEREK